MATTRPERPAHPITVYGAEVLRTTCAPVTEFDSALAALIEEMFTAMYAARGVGLAANQIGVSGAVFVYDCPDATGERQVGHVVNPVLRPSGAFARTVAEEEGCLSIPGPRADVPRAELASVDGFDRTGAAVRLTGTGRLARCFQHETDHLRGVLYIDHLGAERRREILAEAGFGAEALWA